MTQFISLLRGINVAGQKKILMKDLKALYENLGFNKVSTYIQSGNVVFQSDMEKTDIQKTIETAIQAHYQFEVPVLVLTKAEFQHSLINQPFTDIDLENDGSKMMISFLSAQPSAEHVETLLTYVNAPERLEINAQTLYLHCPNGYGKTKLSNNFVEKKLKLVATTRNLKSVTKLMQLLDAP
jgi:uncharacterized protein (DUF1697 family)